MAWGDGISGNVFSTAGTMSLSTGYSDGYGGNGVSLAEAADLGNGSYDYVSSGGGITGWYNDAQEQSRLGGYYPAAQAAGSPWWDAAATTGVTRAIDSVARAYATVKGSQAVTYAGQNGRTYMQLGRTGLNAQLGSGMLPLLLIGGAMLLIMKK